MVTAMEGICYAESNGLYILDMYFVCIECSSLKLYDLATDKADNLPRLLPRVSHGLLVGWLTLAMVLARRGSDHRPNMPSTITSALLLSNDFSLG
jgi:hypothetical protein